MPHEARGLIRDTQPVSCLAARGDPPDEDLAGPAAYPRGLTGGQRTGLGLHGKRISGLNSRTSSYQRNATLMSSREVLFLPSTRGAAPHEMRVHSSPCFRSTETCR